MDYQPLLCYTSHKYLLTNKTQVLKVTMPKKKKQKRKYTNPKRNTMSSNGSLKALPPQQHQATQLEKEAAYIMSQLEQMAKIKEQDSYSYIGQYLAMASDISKALFLQFPTDDIQLTIDRAVTYVEALRPKLQTYALHLKDHVPVNENMEIQMKKYQIRYEELEALLSPPVPASPEPDEVLEYSEPDEVDTSPVN